MNEKKLIARKDIKFNYTADKILIKANKNQSKAVGFDVKPDIIDNKNLLQTDVENQKRWQNLRKMKMKGYCKILTNVGALNIELHFDVAPCSCEKFVNLALESTFDGGKFAPDDRRSFLLFSELVSKRGNEKPEITLEPHERGTLSLLKDGILAICLKPLSQLNRNNSAFGRVVGGSEVLFEIEESERNIFIESVKVLVNPIQKLKESERKKEEVMEEQKRETDELEQLEEDRRKRQELKRKAEESSVSVGRYLNRDNRNKVEMKSKPQQKNKKTKLQKVWNFDNW